MSGHADVLIVGGGVGGLATAVHLGRAGCRATLLEQAPLPRDKVCGEGLMPWGLSMLGDLGIDPASLPGCDFDGLEYRTARGSACLRFPEGGHGRGMPRTVLIRALEEAARAQPTVRMLHERALGVVVEGKGASRRIVGVQGSGGIHRAGVVVAADGVRSGLARQAGVALHARGERYALRQHFYRDSGEPWRGADERMRVGVGLLRAGNLGWDTYLTPVGERTILATTMTDEAGLRRIREDYVGYLAHSPFGDWTDGSRPCSRLLGWRHALFVPEQYHVQGMLLVGDAGGGADPCLGVGMTLALASSGEAAAVIPRLTSAGSHSAEREEALFEFDRNRKILFQHFNTFDKIFRLLIRSRLGGEALVGGMRHWPDVADALLAIVGAGKPWSGFPWGALFRPRFGRRGGVEGVSMPPQVGGDWRRTGQDNKERG